LHKCFFDILRYVIVVAAKLSSWRCGNKLIKASWHLKDQSKNRKLSNSQKSKPSRRGTSNKNWTLGFSLSFSRKKKDFDNS